MKIVVGINAELQDQQIKHKCHSVVFCTSACIRSSAMCTSCDLCHSEQYKLYTLRETRKYRTRRTTNVCAM
jgi:hypothetical protein